MGGQGGAQSVEHLIPAQVMISRFEPCMGLCAGSAEPAWDSLSFSLFTPSLLALSLSLSLSEKKNKNHNLNLFLFLLFPSHFFGFNLLL